MTVDTGLPPRYEIRTLGMEHLDWCKALIMHSNVFGSPIWAIVYPENKTHRLYETYHAIDYLVRHQLESGLSLGIIDKEYVYKKPESAATGGRLYWDLKNENVEEDELLEQMDFPLVSVALAYDGFNKLDHARIEPLIATLPPFGVMYAVLAERDPRDPDSWQPKVPGQVLMRNATATKLDEESHGFMKILARYMMHKAASEGFRGIQIETAHDAVSHVWGKPPSPFVGHRVSELNSDYALKDENGNTSYPFYPAKQDMVKIYVDLKP
ncbi:hypothetical protein PFICI_04222 [Pestalotiopsis fici W106-1]|uniref:Uncharacterized protein n=1 Tax=Pestalotiopsis fici (strain W106-1 / CGMCC3.15140) TaxID=1229662 RepID=W3XAZ6_PESFW|nr:uncharacterized protein PFICI_04222 [Pestalotiopsis fici W106-1]ETS82346.1 hypothetical protein PFICI_04222 [Pestalotiopsis fici W106-1]